MYKLIKQIIFALRYKHAVRKANLMARCYGMRYYVIVSNGRLRVVPKQVIKDLVKNHRFRHGVKIEDIERLALYITANSRESREARVAR